MAATPAAVAALLTARGYGASRMTVLEHLDGDKERCLEGAAAEWPANDVADLNTIAVDCIAGDRISELTRFETALAPYFGERP